MKLTVLGSGSAGNGYVLEGRDSALLLECGVKPEVMMRTCSVQLSRIAGALVTHEHLDHSGYMDRYANLGIPIYASAGTFVRSPRLGQHAVRMEVKAMQSFRVGGFTVSAFDTRHDAQEPLGFIIEHQECGRILFLTDTAFCPYDFRSLHLHHVLVESNYHDRLLDENVETGIITPERADRTRRTHLSLQGACDLIRADQTADLVTVVLIHLSRHNADPAYFVQRASETALFAKVYAAQAGLSINLPRTEI